MPYYLRYQQAGIQAQKWRRDRGTKTRFTYRLQEATRQVLVDGQVPLLLLRQSGLNGGLLNRHRHVSRGQQATGHGPIARH